MMQVLNQNCQVINFVCAQMSMTLMTQSIDIYEIDDKLSIGNTSINLMILVPYLVLHLNFILTAFTQVASTELCRKRQIFKMAEVKRQL